MVITSLTVQGFDHVPNNAVKGGGAKVFPNVLSKTVEERLVDLGGVR